MKAIILKEPGSVEQLVYTELDTPVISEGEVLVKVSAISINPVDAKTRAGKGMYGRIKNEDPLILGWDISGTVTESRSPLFGTGDQVFGMVKFPGHGKAYAEYVAAPAEHLALVPEGISFDQAAATTLVALTAWQAMVHHARVKPGQKVLIHAAAGGVGHLAVQIAKHLGAEVTGTSSPANKDFVTGRGADHHINYHGYDWQAHGREFDFVLDTIGGENIEHSIAVTKEGGTLISIPTGLNEQVTEKAKQQKVNGSFILVQSSGEDMREIAALLAGGALKPFVSKTFGFDEMGAAHLAQETGRTVGKLVIML